MLPVNRLRLIALAISLWALRGMANSIELGPSIPWPPPPVTQPASSPASRKGLLAPANLVAVPVSCFDANLSWMDRSANESGFKVERSKNGGPFFQIAQLGPNSVNFRDHNLFPNTSYRYRVRAFNATGDSTYSNLDDARTFSPSCPLSVAEWGGAAWTDIVAVADGYFHTVALRANGTVVCWGSNSNGQSSPPTNLNSVVAIAASDTHSLALRSDGTMIGWGYGQFDVAVPPTNVTDVAAIATSPSHSLALTRQGLVVGWGEDGTGAATPPANLSNVVAIAAGGTHSLALKSDGTVVGWGANDFGQASPPPNLNSVVAIAAGYSHSLALRKNGTVVAWGADPYGYSTATPPPNLKGVVGITASDFISLALKADGSVVAWGVNAYLPPELVGVAAISIAGGRHTALTVTPAGPRLISARIASAHNIELAWLDTSSNETGFEIERTIRSSQTPSNPWKAIGSVKAGVTNFADRTAVTNTTYQYRIRARGRCGNSIYSELLTITVSPPTGPYSVEAHPGAANQVRLSWYDFDNNVEGIKIERAVDAGGSPGAWVEVGISTTAGSHLDSIPAGNATYWYRLRAFNALGSSPYSYPTSVTVAQPVNPPYLTATQFAEKALLTWTEESGGGTVETFKIERAPDDGGVPGLWAQIGSTTNLFFSDSNLTVNTIYWYRVRASNWVGDTLPGNQVFVAMLPPATPSNLTVTIGLSNRVDLVWVDNLGDQDGFKVERAPDLLGGPGTWHEIGSVSQANVFNGSYADTTALPNQSYWYRVRAFNALGNSGYSSSVQTFLFPPAPPYLFGGSDGARVSLFWSRDATGFMGLRIFHAPDVNGAPGAWTLISEQPPAAADFGTFVDGPYPVDSIQWYRAQTFTWAGVSDLSPTISVTLSTPPPPPPPTAPTAFIGDLRVSLSWFEYSSDAFEFSIERAPDISGVPGFWAQIGTTTNASHDYGQFYYDDTQAAANTIYWYRVRAHGTSGDSDASDATQVVVGPPSAPFILDYHSFRNDISLFWYEPVPAFVEAYRIERAPDIEGNPGTWNEISTTTNTFFTDFGHALGSVFWYRLRAHNWNGDSPYSASVRVQVSPPATPYSLSATIGTTNMISLDWSYYFGDQDGFIIDRATEVEQLPGEWMQIGTIAATNYSPFHFIDTNAAPHVTYWYRVRAYNNLGAGDYSDAARIPLDGPPAPFSVWASQLQSGISLYWSYDYYRSLIALFKIERAPDNGGPGEWTEVGVATSQYFTDTNVLPNTQYWYRLRAADWTGISAESELATAIVVLPTAPDQLQASIGDTNQVILSWADLYYDLDAFRIERAPDTGGAPGVWQVIGTATNADHNFLANFTDNNAPAYTTNWYRVQAFNSAGESSYAGPVDIIVAPPANPPVITYAQPLSPNQTELQWYESQNNVAGFKIERAPEIAGAPGTWKQIAQSGNPSPYGAFDDHIVLPNHAYWYRLQGTNWMGQSPYTPPVRVSTGPPPGPVNLTASSHWRNQINLSWINTDTNYLVQGITIERALDNDGVPGGWLPLAQPLPGQTTYTDLDVVTGTTYWYRARGFNYLLGASPYSNEASASVPNGDFVRVMQWNVERGLGRQNGIFSTAAQAIARIIKYNEPDVILLCEVDTQGLSEADNRSALISWITNSVPYLGNQPGASFYVGTASRTDGFIRNAVISRFPIADETTYDDGLRGLHAFRVELPTGNAMQIFHTHLKCCADDCSRKQTEAQIDAAIVSAFAATNSLPYLFAGDLNEDQEHPVCPYSATYNPLQTIREGANLAEFKPSTLSGDSRTWSSAAANPSIRFDYILGAANRITPISGYVFRSDDWQNHGVYGGFYYNDSYSASDHYCVVANYYFPPLTLTASPETLASSGYQGGPFNPATRSFTLSNSLPALLSWSVKQTAAWLTLSADNGVLGPSQTTNIAISVNASANALPAASYHESLVFSNVTAGELVAVRLASLDISSVAQLAVTPDAPLSSVGAAGGPFLPDEQIYTLSNSGIASLTWTAGHTANWLAVSPDGGILAPGGVTNVLVAIAAGAASLPADYYSDLVTFANTTTGAGDTVRQVDLTIARFGFYDDFSTFASGALVGQRGWIQALAPSTLPLQISAGRLNIPGSQTGDNQDALKNFTTTNGTVYYGMNLIVSNAPAGSAPSYFAALYTGNNAGGFANFRLSAHDVGGGKYTLGARITGQASTPYKFGATGLTYDSLHRVIVEATGGGATMKVFLDPTNSSLADQAVELVANIGSGTPPVEVGSFVFSQFASAGAPILGVTIGRVVVIDNFQQAYELLTDDAPPAASLAASIPIRILATIPSTNDLQITWQAVGGTTNFVQAAADFAGPYSNISGAIIVPGTGVSTASYLDAGIKTNLAPRFYRIRLAP